MPCSSTYCINNTGLVGADDTYITGGTYNGYTYWSGQTNGWVIFYSTGTTNQWCLSDTFSGTCSLAGKTPCYSACPDLSNSYVYSGVCPTPTPTPTNNCNVLDFNAVFDCEFIPTPSVTPTSTITPTPTITPTATNPCSIVGIDAIAYKSPMILPLMFMPVPLMFMSENYEPLQMFEPLNILNCGVSGDVTFNLINDDIVCTSILTFQNCYDNELYYCSNVSLLPNQSLELYQVYRALVDNESNCITYIGNSNNNIDINTNEIIIETISFGNVNNGKCIECEEYAPSTTLCFEYIGLGPDILYQCNVQAQPTLYNGRNYWVLNGCPTDSWNSYPECPIIDNNNYIWWNGSSWVHSDTLGGGFVFTTLSNPELLPIEILGTYEWTSALINYSTCAPQIRNSSLEPCIPI
jgi:hypothetical protein